MIRAEMQTSSEQLAEWSCSAVTPTFSCKAHNKSERAARASIAALSAATYVRRAARRPSARRAVPPVRQPVARTTTSRVGAYESLRLAAPHTSCRPNRSSSTQISREDSWLTNEVARSTIDHYGCRHVRMVVAAIGKRSAETERVHKRLAAGQVAIKSSDWVLGYGVH
jgi:hypothetical protein